MTRFASGDDQPREAMSRIGRWQTRKGSPKPGRRLKARRPRRSAARLQAGCRRSIGFCRRDAADGDALAKTGVAGSLGGHEPATGPFSGPAGGKRGSRGQSPVRGAAEGCQGRRSALKPHIGREAKISTGLLPSYVSGNPRGEPNDGNKGADLALPRRGESLDNRTAELEAAVRAQARSREAAWAAACAPAGAIMFWLIRLRSLVRAGTVVGQEPGE